MFTIYFSARYAVWFAARNDGPTLGAYDTLGQADAAANALNALL